MSETQELKKKILKIMQNTGLDFERAKMRYKIELQESMRETEREMSEIIKKNAESIVSEILLMLEDEIGDEFEIEAQWTEDGHAMSFNFIRKDLEGFDALKEQLSQVLRLEETKHLTLEIVKTEDGEFEVQIISRAE